MIILQARLLIPSTFCLKLIFTELFDTTRGFLNPDVQNSLNILETINPTVLSNRGKFMTISQANTFGPEHFLAKVDIYGVI